MEKITEKDNKRLIERLKNDPTHDLIKKVVVDFLKSYRGIVIGCEEADRETGSRITDGVMAIVGIHVSTVMLNHSRMYLGDEYQDVLEKHSNFVLSEMERVMG